MARKTPTKAELDSMSVEELLAQLAKTQKRGEGFAVIQVPVSGNDKEGE